MAVRCGARNARDWAPDCEPRSADLARLASDPTHRNPRQPITSASACNGGRDRRDLYVYGSAGG
jgi:hypothetical protein